ncbi:MAG: ERCC4 domain-containing protein [Actinomycetota bacterium]|nr:ERCC4 domain-containing protein [Actinomycetota bacterium]
MIEPRFVVAKNPDPDSSLPFLVRLPIGEEGLVLKTREPWPRTAKVYCHRAAEDEWHNALEIVEDVGVRSCVRRGVAIDLVLDRGKEHRSQFVFTRLKGGREGIFWQSAKTTRQARPSVRVPGRRASYLPEFRITVDTRERYAYRFAKQQAETVRAKLPVGDYGVIHDHEVVALVERKSMADLTKSLSDGGLAFQLADLATHPHAAVVVEERYSQVFKNEYVAGGWLADLVAQLQVRYPTVPIMFCETRPLAEEWTFRFLGAALAGFLDTGDDPTAPREWRD